MNAESHRFFKPAGFRVIQPPGGRTNDIFSTSRSAANGHSHTMMQDSQPAKFFSADANSNSQNGVARASPRRFENTQTRLFGGDDDRRPASPRRVNATFAPSSIFTNDDAPKSPARTPKKSIPIFERNPITGELKPPRTPQHQPYSNGHAACFGVNGHSNGHANGHANGHSNGHTNGHSNGHHYNGHSENGVNGAAQKRIPPGGYCNGVI